MIEQNNSVVGMGGREEMKFSSIPTGMIKKTAIGPCWVIEVDNVEHQRIVGADFHTRGECFAFKGQHPGNFSLTHVSEGRVLEYTVLAPMPQMKTAYAAWAEELRNYGSCE